MSACILRYSSLISSAHFFPLNSFVKKKYDKIRWNNEQYSSDCVGRHKDKLLIKMPRLNHPIMPKIVFCRNFCVLCEVEGIDPPLIGLTRAKKFVVIEET